jgi:hypothetical protein
MPHFPKDNYSILTKSYSYYLVVSALTFIFLLAYANLSEIALYALFFSVSVVCLKLGFLAKFISISFYIFVYSRIVFLYLFPDTFNFPYSVDLYDGHANILLYSLYYYVCLILSCILFEQKKISQKTPVISKKIVTCCMLYMAAISITFILNNTAFSFSNYGYSQGFLIVKKIYNHSNFVLIVLLLFYSGFIRRIFLGAMLAVSFIYYPSKAIIYNILAPILIAREMRGKDTKILNFIGIIAIFAIVYALADTFRVNSFLHIEHFLDRLHNALIAIIGRVGFNYDMALYFGDNYNGVFNASDIVKSVINGYVPGEIFQTERIFTGSDLQALEENKSIEAFDRLGGGYTMGYFLFDRAYFGSFAPLISIIFMYPILKVYNKGNIVYKIIIAIGFFEIAVSDSVLHLTKILNNIVLFYLFSLIVNNVVPIFNLPRKKI